MKAKTRKPQKPRPGYSLAEHNPELMSEYSEKNEYPASRLCFGADYPVWWKCPKGHKDYEATPKSRTRKKAPARCDKCRYGDISKKHSTPSKEKSLGYLYPDLIPFWSPKNTKSPSEVYAYSDSEEYWWICPKHIHKNYLMNCYRRTTALIGCPGCSHTGIPPYEESLGYLYPNLAKEWFVGNDLTSYEVWPGGSYLALWVCPKGHKNYPATCCHRTSKKPTGCPECGNEIIRDLKLFTPFNKSLAYLNPLLSLEWSPKNIVTPFEVKVGSSTEYWWTCPNGHEDYLAPCSRRSQGSGCILCGHKRTGEFQATPKYEESLEVIDPNLSLELSPRNARPASKIFPHSNFPDDIWVCKTHGDYYMSANERSNGRSCSDCTTVGSSIPERLLREALLPFGASSYSQTKISNWKVDIYIPSSKTVVEYDGSYYHSFEGSWERDRRKSLELLEMGYRVVRVRSWSRYNILTSLDISNKYYFEVFCKDQQPTIETIDSVVHKII